MAYRKVNAATGICSKKGSDGPCSACEDINNPLCAFPGLAELAAAVDEPGNLLEFPGLFNLIQFPRPAIG
jgi:hypothetical protein